MIVYVLFVHKNLFQREKFVLWRIESGSCAERNPGPIDDDYINVFPDLLCQLIVSAH